MLADAHGAARRPGPQIALQGDHGIELENARHLPEPPQAMPVWSILRLITSHVRHFGPQEWFLSLIGVVVLGIVCLRGFGSRSEY